MGGDSLAFTAASDPAATVTYQFPGIVQLLQIIITIKINKESFLLY